MNKRRILLVAAAAFAVVLLARFVYLVVVTCMLAGAIAGAGGGEIARCMPSVAASYFKFGVERVRTGDAFAGDPADYGPKARREGEEAGAATTVGGCVAITMAELREPTDSIAERVKRHVRFEGCLKAASPDDACAGAPARDDYQGLWAWIDAKCAAAGLPRHDECTHRLKALHWHCTAPPSPATTSAEP